MWRSFLTDPLQNWIELSDASAIVYQIVAYFWGRLSMLKCFICTWAQGSFAHLSKSIMSVGGNSIRVTECNILLLWIMNKGRCQTFGAKQSLSELLWACTTHLIEGVEIQFLMSRNMKNLQHKISHRRMLGIFQRLLVIAWGFQMNKSCVISE